VSVPLVYGIGGSGIQVDYRDASFVFVASRFGARRVEVLDVQPASARSRARDALIGALVQMAVKS
jgi:hypothetical protein